MLKRTDLIALLGVFKRTYQGYCFLKVVTSLPTTDNKFMMSIINHMFVIMKIMQSIITSTKFCHF